MLLAQRTDAELITGSLADPESFAAVFERHFADVHRYLSRRVGSHRADDLAAATFTTAFARRREFDCAHESARPWLFGIATRLLLGERRRERRMLERVARLAELHRSDSLVARDKSRDPLDAELAAALRRLDPGRRDALLLFVWAELSYEEIAVALGLPLGTVRSRIARARQELRDQLRSEPKETS